MAAHNGFGVDMQALQAASKGVQDAVDELNAMTGWTAGSTNAGKDGQGLKDGITAAVMDIGHEGLEAALVGFADDWEWGVRTMVDEAVSTTDALNDTRSEYQKAEDAVIGTLKDSAQWAVDPNADGSASEKSWKQIADESIQTTTDSYTSSDPWSEVATKPGRVFQQLTGLGGDQQ